MKAVEPNSWSESGWTQFLEWKQLNPILGMKAVEPNSWDEGSWTQFLGWKRFSPDDEWDRLCPDGDLPGFLADFWPGRNVLTIWDLLLVHSLFTAIWNNLWDFIWMKLIFQSKEIFRYLDRACHLGVRLRIPEFRGFALCRVQSYSWLENKISSDYLGATEFCSASAVGVA